MGRVQLAVSPLGGIPGATAYHTSVLVEGEEFSFSDAGVSRARGPSSHSIPGKAPRILDIGTSKHSGDQMLAKLEPHFRAGTYDLLKKNCNSFSDCALYFLVQQRLNPEYRTLDRMGGQMPALVQAVSRMGAGGGAAGPYAPNERAAAFDVEGLIRDLDPEKHWRTPGKATGGAPAAATADSLRAARLARFSGGGGGSGEEAALGRTPASSSAASQGGVPPSQYPQPGGADEERFTWGRQTETEPDRTRSTQGDEEMARRLQEQEESSSYRPPMRTGYTDRLIDPIQASRSHSSSRPRAAAPARGPRDVESDEEMARRLQAEEEAATRGPAAPSQATTGRASAGPGPHAAGGPGGAAPGVPVAQIVNAAMAMSNLLDAFSQNQQRRPQSVSGAGASPSVGVAAGTGRAAGGSAGGLGGGPGVRGPAMRTTFPRQPAQSMQDVVQQIETQVVRLGSQLQQVQQQVNTGPMGQLNVHRQHLQQSWEQAGQGSSSGRPRGASAQQVEGSTTLLTFDGRHAGREEADRQCMVCLENFREGEELRLLPCFHRFHKECIDPWLRRNCQCPTCNHRFGNGHGQTIGI